MFVSPVLVTVVPAKTPYAEADPRSTVGSTEAAPTDPQKLTSAATTAAAITAPHHWSVASDRVAWSAVEIDNVLLGKSRVEINPRDLVSDRTN